MALIRPFSDAVHKWTFGHARSEKAFGKEAFQRAALGYRMSLRESRRFSIDDAMTELAVEASKRQDRFPLWINLAKLPYDKIWVEWDQTAKIQASAKIGFTEKSPDGFEDTPRPTGLLMERIGEDPSNWIATEFTGGLDCDPLLVRYGLWTEGSAENPACVPKGSRSVDDILTNPLNNGAHTLMGYGTRDPFERFFRLDWFRHKITASLLPLYQQREEKLMAAALQRGTKEDVARIRARHMEEVENSLVSRRGTFRFIIAVLAMMNEVPVEIGSVAARNGRTMAGGRAIPFLSYETLSVDLPKKRRLPAMTRMLTAAYKKKRAHEVRGHWRRITRDFLGSETDVTRSGKQVVQGEDGTARIWIDKHVRGDASLGWVQKDYAIKGGEPPSG